MSYSPPRTWLDGERGFGEEIRSPRSLNDGFSRGEGVRYYEAGEDVLNDRGTPLVHQRRNR